MSYTEESTFVHQNGLSGSLLTDEQIEALKKEGVKDPEKIAAGINKRIERQAKYWEYGTYGVLGLLLFGGVYGLTKAVTD